MKGVYVKLSLNDLWSEYGNGNTLYFSDIQ